MLNLKASRTIYTVFTALPPLSLLFVLFDALFFFLFFSPPLFSWLWDRAADFKSENLILNSSSVIHSGMSKALDSLSFGFFLCEMSIIIPCCCEDQMR